MTLRACGLAALLALVAALPQSLAAAEDIWSGGLGAAQIFSSNVFGTESSPADGIVDGRGWLAWSPGERTKAELSGRLVRFLDNPTLTHGYLRTALGSERLASGDRLIFGAGAAGELRLNGPVYAVYDYRDLSAHAAAKRYFSPMLTAQLRADLSTRSYPDFAREDSRKLSLTARLHRSFPSRTSLTATGRVGWKLYTSAAHDSLGAGTRAARGEATLAAAQSISARLAIRGWATWSRLFRSVDSSRQLAGFENPLIDEFSAEGIRVGLAAKVLLPGGVLADLSAERWRAHYPGRPPTIYDPVADIFLVDGDDQLLLAPGERRDTLFRARLDVEKPLGSKRGRSLRVGFEWSDQDSNDLYWGWRGWAVDAGVTFAL